MPLASEDTGKRETLLGYWMEHNREHSQEFREWAEKVTSRAEVGEDLMQAARADKCW